MPMVVIAMNLFMNFFLVIIVTTTPAIFRRIIEYMKDYSYIYIKKAIIQVKIPRSLNPWLV